MKKSIAIVIVLTLVFSLAAACGGGTKTTPWSEVIELENIEIRGVSENSSPLSASNIKILQKQRERIYCLILN